MVTLDDVMAKLNEIEQRQTHQTGLIAALTEGVQIMSSTVDNTKAAIDQLIVKDDALLAAFQTIATSNASLQAMLTGLQQQVAQLQQQIASGDPSPGDVVTLASAVSEAQAEGAKIDAALATITPPAQGAPKSA